jgi:glycosyltransferase involved in cell wall biosynthesis
MNVNEQPAASVLMITYNQEGYIRDAIDSVLCQRTDFKYELVIGDDCSTDRTAAIIAEYRDKHPDVIRIIEREKNLGPQRNFVQTLRSCRGRFVALLEGDDYWTSDDKLNRQVELLRSRPECAICFSRARVVTEDGSQEPWDYPLWDQAEYTLEDLLKENFIPTCTAVFRQGLLLEIPDWFYGLDFGDWALHLLLAQHGGVFLLSETMAVYRVHSHGVWSRLSKSEMDRKREEFRSKLAERILSFREPAGSLTASRT